MGKKSGISCGSYHPKIWMMQYVMGQREMLREQEQRMISKKKLRNSYWTQRLSNAINCLRTVDPQGFERWFDNDENVPADAKYREITWLVEARVKQLTGSFPIIKARAHRSIFIWQDQLGIYVYSKEVGKETLYVIEFDSLEGAQSFINGLPIHNLGYGVVLDILPAPMVSTVTATAER